MVPMNSSLPQFSDPNSFPDELPELMDKLLDSVQKYCNEHAAINEEPLSFTATVLSDTLPRHLTKPAKRPPSPKKHSPDTNTTRRRSHSSSPTNTPRIGISSKSPRFGEGYRESMRKLRRMVRMDLSIETINLELAAAIARKNDPLLCKHTVRIWGPLMSKLDMDVSCMFVALLIESDVKAALEFVKQLTLRDEFPGISGSIVLASLPKYLADVEQGHNEERKLYYEIVEESLNENFDIIAYFEQVCRIGYSKRFLLDHFEELLKSIKWNLNPKDTKLFFKIFSQGILDQLDNNAPELVKLIRLRRLVQQKCKIPMENVWDSEENLTFLKVCSQMHLGYGEVTSERAKCFLHILQKSPIETPRYEIKNQRFEKRPLTYSTRTIDHHQFSKLLESLLKNPQFLAFANKNEGFKHDIGLIIDEIIRCKPLFLNFRLCAYRILPLFPDKAFKLLQVELQPPLAKSIKASSTIEIFKIMLASVSDKTKKDVLSLLTRKDLQELFQDEYEWKEYWKSAIIEKLKIKDNLTIEYFKTHAYRTQMTKEQWIDVFNQELQIENYENHSDFILSFTDTLNKMYAEPKLKSDSNSKVQFVVKQSALLTSHSTPQLPTLNTVKSTPTQPIIGSARSKPPSPNSSPTEVRSTPSPTLSRLVKVSVGGTRGGSFIGAMRQMLPKSIESRPIEVR